jgi:hypothetical protein
MESARSFTSQTRESFSSFLLAGQLSSGLDFANLLPGQKGGQEEASETETKNGSTNRMEDFRTRLNGFTSHAVSGRAMVLGNRDHEGQLRSIRQQCIDFLFQMLFRGKDRKIGTFEQNQNQNQNGVNEQQNAVNMPATELFMIAGTQRTFEYSESETTTFSTTGTVRTADGREIEFDLNIYMSREFKAVYEETFIQAASVFTDPLVINLDGFIAELSDQNFFFDIDSDGIMDNIAMLSNRSGYLAWDKNGDGTVNCGNELFGTASGNGFADLSVHDLDKNGWIDESDEIWKHLLIWIMEADGSSNLYTLAEKGLGAIYLGNVDTQFALTNAVNETKGMIRSSGLFLYESGAVGSVQQVDVVKFEA